MEDKNSSISIINKNNGSLTGEKADALPIRLVTTNSGFKFFILGFISAILVMGAFIFLAKRQVTVVDISGKAAEYVEYEIK